MTTQAKRSWKLQEFTAHGDNVNCLALGHKSGRVLATGGDDKKINLWAIGKQDCIISLSGHVTPVECVKFGYTEDLVCAGSQAGVLKVWDLEAAKLVRTLSGHRYGIKCVDFHPYGNFLASGSLDTAIKLWDMRCKGCIFTYKGHERTVNSAKFSPDGQWIASGDENGILKIWDLRVGHILKELSKHTGAITDVEFHPHEFLLASSSADRSVRFWDLENFQLVSKAEREASTVRCLSFSIGGECLFGGRDEQLIVYGWEPTRIYDTVTIGWGKVQDMAITQNQLIGASFYLSSVLVCAVDLAKVAPFASLSQTSVPFARDVTRKSFSKQKPNTESKLKIDVKPIEESETEPEDESSLFIPDVNDYKSVFNPHRSLNRSPPLLIYNSAPAHTRSSTIQVIPTSAQTLASSSQTVAPIIHNAVPASQTLTAPITNIQSSTRNYSSDQNSLSLNQISVSINRSVVSSNQNVTATNRNHLVNSNIQSVNSTKPSTNLSKLSINRTTTSSVRSVSPVNHVVMEKDNVSPINVHLPPLSRNLSSISNNLSAANQLSINKTSSVKSFSTHSSLESSSGSSTSSNVMNDTHQSYDSEIVSAPSNMPNGLSMDDFLPAGYKRTANHMLNKETPEAEALQVIHRGHASMVAVLKTRKKSLEIIYTLWRKKDLKCAMEEAVLMNDLAIIADILSIINSKPFLWNLDICGILLPVILNLLQSKFEIYMSIGCDAIYLILRNFSPVIKTNILWSSSTIGVDVSKEERYNKCMKCYRSLVSIRTFLLKRQTVQGKLGQSFRDLHTMLQEIDTS